MKQYNIKYILITLILSSNIASAEPTIPSDSAKKSFAGCVTRGNAWADCYHFLRPTENYPAENNTEEPEPATDYYAPRWVYWVLPTFNPPDYTPEPSPWKSYAVKTNSPRGYQDPH